MVLDEDALERMIGKRPADTPKESAEGEEDQPPRQVELTQATEEFEVYERAPDGDEISPVIPEAFTNSPQSDDAHSKVETAPRTSSAPPVPEPTVSEPQQQDDEPARPRVWPPLSSSPEATQSVPAAESAMSHVEANDVSEPLAAPEVPEPEAPEMEPANQEPLQAEFQPANPHPHAHAELDVEGGGVRVAIIQALFNQEITDMMTELALAKARKRGAEVTHHVTVPGVYDLPLVTARLLERDDVDCAVVIGVVIQGETAHDNLITGATAQTLQQLSLDVDKPIGFGITGPGMTWPQAEARVANGAHAVDAALAQVEALKTV